MNTVDFSCVITSEDCDDATSDFEEGVSGLPKDSNWNATLVDQSEILYVSENSADVNNAK